MKQEIQEVKSRLKTDELPFKLAPEIKHWIECWINRVSDKSEGLECQIIFPDKYIDR